MAPSGTKICILIVIHILVLCSGTKAHISDLLPSIGMWRPWAWGDLDGLVAQHPRWLFNRMYGYLICRRPTLANATIADSRCDADGHKIEVVCDEGYEFSDMETRKIFNCSNTLPAEFIDLNTTVCQAIECPPLDLENTDPDPIPQSPYMTSITVRCQDGHKFEDNPNTDSYNTTCQANKEWDTAENCIQICSNEYTYIASVGLGYRVIDVENIEGENLDEKCEEVGGKIASTVGEFNGSSFDPAFGPLFGNNSNLRIGLYKHPIRREWLWMDNDTIAYEQDADEWCNPPRTGHQFVCASLSQTGCLDDHICRRNQTVLCQKECAEPEETW